MIKNRAMDYNKRKIEVLELARRLDRGIIIKDVQHYLKISYTNAKTLLHYYHIMELLNRPRRGLYRISKRGKDRLEYLKTRQEISNVTGIDITLNFRKRPPVPAHEIITKYKTITGKPWPHSVRL